MLKAFCASLALILALTSIPIGAVHAQSQQQQQRGRQPQPPPQPPPQAAPQPAPPAPAATPAPPPPPVAPPAAQPRAAEQPPVPVRIVEPPKTAAQLAAEAQEREREREERATFNSRLLMYSGLLVVIGLLLAVAFLVQSLYLWLALRGVRKSTRAIERNMTTAQRAFLYIGTMGWSLAGQNVKIAPAWANSGSTPTRNLRISTNWKASHGELPADFVFTYARPPERLFLGPGGRADVGSALIPMRDLQAAIEERVHLYFWGRATYEDMFEGSEPHFLEFCYRLDVAGATPDKIALTFTHYGAHNRSDEDSVRVKEI
jgi:hypothetical protein